MLHTEHVECNILGLYSPKLHSTGKLTEKAEEVMVGADTIRNVPEQLL